MKTWAAIILIQLPVWSGVAQTFSNLDFESANLTPVAGPNSGNVVEVPFDEALPGWSGFFGTDAVTQVLQNNMTLGSISIDVLGPGWAPTPFESSLGILGGNYSVLLQDGFHGTPPPFGDSHPPVTLSQTGTVPSVAKSIEFDVAGDAIFEGVNLLSVSFDGQNLPLADLQSEPNFDIYGVDISGFAGQSGTLSFTETPDFLDAGGLFVGVELDGIVFSPNAIPEPATWELMVCCAGLFGGMRYGRRLKV